jgi:hypothetical protein
MGRMGLVTPLGSTPPNPHTAGCVREAKDFQQRSAFGSRGLQANVRFFNGWRFKTGCGLPIDVRDMEFRQLQTLASPVCRILTRWTTFCFTVSTPRRFGFCRSRGRTSSMLRQLMNIGGLVAQCESKIQRQRKEGLRRQSNTHMLVSLEAAQCACV